LSFVLTVPVNGAGRSGVGSFVWDNTAAIGVVGAEACVVSDTDRIILKEYDLDDVSLATGVFPGGAAAFLQKMAHRNNVRNGYVKRMSGRQFRLVVVASRSDMGRLEAELIAGAQEQHQFWVMGATKCDECPANTQIGTVRMLTPPQHAIIGPDTPPESAVKSRMSSASSRSRTPSGNSNPRTPSAGSGQR
jgi:hypothetical protein